MKKILALILVAIMICTGCATRETSTMETITDAEAQAQLRLMILAAEAYAEDPTEENYKAVWCAYGLFGGAESNGCWMTYDLWESVVYRENENLQQLLVDAREMLEE